MTYVAICDDNKPILDFLNGRIDDLLTESGMDHEICSFQSGCDFLESHIKRPFDVVFYIFLCRN